MKEQFDMEGKRILMVDDDPDYVDAVKMVLEKADYSVEAVYSPRDGYRALETGTYDLVILDCMMGRGAEGIIVARKLRKKKELGNLPVLMITGIRDQTGFFFVGDPKDEAFLPVDGFLEKPVDPSVLLKEVGKLLHSRKTEESKKGE
jgi:DNA-binding response OmpR family regulator